MLLLVVFSEAKVSFR